MERMIAQFVKTRERNAAFFVSRVESWVFRCVGLRLWFIFQMVVIGGIASEVSVAATNDVSFHIRIVWGGGTPRPYEGVVRLDQGAMSIVQHLGVDPHASLHASSQSPREVRLHAKPLVLFGGIDLRITADRLAHLSLRIGEGSQGEGTEGRWSMEELLRERQSLVLEPSKHRIVLERPSHDLFRCRIKPSKVIFGPGENIETEVSSLYTDLPAGPLRIHAELIGTDRKRVLVDDVVEGVVDRNGTMGPLTIPLWTAPAEEGVYQIRLTFDAKRFLPRFKGESHVVRLMELIVLDPSRPRRRDIHWKESKDLPLKELAPGGTSELRLDGLAVGEPHQLVVHSEAPRDDVCLIRILDEEAMVEGGNLTMDVGFASNGNRREELGATNTFRNLFWPRSERVHLIIANPTDRPLSFHKIEIVRGGTQFRETENQNLLWQKDERLAVLELDKLFLADSFGGEKSKDALSEKSLDSWQTFFSIFEHMVDYCHHMGFNAICLPAISEGQSIYGSQLLPSSARFDSGVFFEDGRGAERKDILELLFRICDREGIRVIPTIDGTGPIESLERIAETSESSPYQIALASTSDLVADDRPLQQSRYEPTDPRVVRYFESFVAELTERYQHHPSWYGLALRLGPQSPFNYGGDRFGYSPSMIDEFEQSVGGKLPREEGERTRYLTGSLRVPWLTWRAKQLSTQHIKLAKKLSQGGSARRVFLLASPLLEPSLESRRSTRGKVNLDEEERLLEYGINPGNYRNPSEVVIIRSQMSRSILPVKKMGIGHSRTPSSSSELTRRGSRILEEPLFTREGESLTRNLRLSEYPHCFELSKSGHEVRRQLLPRLSREDDDYWFFGGWRVAQCLPPEVAPLLKAFTQLPTDPWEEVMSSPVGEQREPFSVSVGKRGSENLYVLRNESPWEIEIALHWGKDTALDSFRWITPSGVKSVQAVNHGVPQALLINPLELVVFGVSESEPQLQAWTSSIPSETKRRIAERLEEVNQWLNQSAYQRSGLAIENGGFELEWIEGEIPGWSRSKLPSVDVTLDNHHPHEGRACLKMTSRKEGGAAWIQSQPFQAPSTGRFAIEFYARSETESPVELQASLVGRRPDGSKWVSQRPIRIMQSEGKRISDLPSKGNKILWHRRIESMMEGAEDEQFDQIQIGFEFQGIGSVGLDRIVVYDRFLTEEERRKLRAELFVAKRDFERGQLASSLRLLESPSVQWLRTLMAEESVNASASSQRLTSLPGKRASEVASAPEDRSDASLERTQRNGEAHRSSDETEKEKSWLQRWRNQFRRKPK